MNSSSRFNRDARADSYERYLPPSARDETFDIVPPRIDITPFMEPLLDNVVSLTTCIYCGRPMADDGLTLYCSSACAAESEGEDRCNDDYDDDGRD